MSSSVVGSVLDSLSPAPGEVQRNYALMRELDRHVDAVLARVGPAEAAASALRRAGRNADADALLAQLRADVRACRALSDEKLALARRTYELLASLVSRVDDRLRDYPLPPPPQQQQQQQQQQSAAAAAEEFSAGEDGGDDEDDGQQMGVREVDENAPIEESEAQYCTCHGKYSGPMIGCDNPSCKNKWFHFSCVGLSVAPPKGRKWYCSECRGLMRKKH